MSATPHLSLATTTRTFEPRTHLPLPADRLWHIESGVVRTFTWTAEGTVITLGLWTIGDVVGHCLSKGTLYYAECLTRVSATSLPPDHWPDLTHALIQHVQLSQELLEILRCGNAEVSFLRLLNWLAHRFGHSQEQGWQIDLRLTHQELADLGGFTRVTVTRLLKRFEQQGLIQRSQRRILVLPESEAIWHYEI